MGWPGYRGPLWTLGNFVEALGLLVLSCLSLAMFPFMLVAAVTIPIAGVGLVLMFLGLLVVRPMAMLQRKWAGRVLGVDLPNAYRTVPADARLDDRFKLITDPALWRDIAWLGVNGTIGFVLCLAQVILTIPMLVGMWANPKLQYINAHVSAYLLAPPASAKLQKRVEELATSRADTVDASAAELRRIERDLHDGAQARLVALSMNLGMAEDALERDPALVKEMLTEARTSTGKALTELRDLVRGIHPPVLADRGLDGGVRALALDLPITVDVDIALPSRLEAPVESAGYFAVAESLANVVKHSGAGHAWVHIRHEDGKLRMQIVDDGRGGADIGAGSGLSGIQKRLAAFDGTLVVTSPLGGPTVVTMEVPCALSSGRISPS
ncbi:sensor histidine kinase [Labedaea rhizosphaerae]|uniref:histidine kinase n=1 Tax=Labedaea rhizosphaerae TaxID=598644 RepID=A0A4R6SIW0_LABRH|nr:histidine kinase [Labedaea rhizosphaerae]TDQ04236.1 signal transduction histidine kinase [Labedaea rhizosphaerae]